MSFCLIGSVRDQNEERAVGTAALHRETGRHARLHRRAYRELRGRALARRTRARSLSRSNVRFRGPGATMGWLPIRALRCGAPTCACMRIPTGSFRAPRLRRRASLQGRECDFAAEDSGRTNEPYRAWCTQSRLHIPDRSFTGRIGAGPTAGLRRTPSMESTGPIGSNRCNAAAANRRRALRQREVRSAHARRVAAWPGPGNACAGRPGVSVP